ncbi:MAG: glycosyltransferase family 4 protein [Rhizomicrobium sp.]|nr:glycosyltransferase family 4 protein [Rhizomicrobium sp.]
MKIAFLLNEITIGGGPKFALDLGQFFAGHGHQVVVAASRRGPWHDLAQRLGLEAWHAPDHRLATTAGRTRAMVEYLVQSGVEMAFLNAGDDNRASHLACRLLPDRIGVAMLFHGGWPRLYELAHQDGASWNIAVGVGPDSYSGALAALPGRPVLGITNGIPLPSPADLGGRRDWQTPLRLLFVGRLLDTHKGILRLPEILLACRQRGLPVQLTVVGDGKDRGRLVQAITAAGLAEDAIRLVGTCPPEAVAEIARDHHLFLFPTNTEGMPLALLEAAANGCVPIVTCLPGVTDVAVEDGVSGRLVAPGDIGGFADQIAQMMAPDIWRRHSQAGIARCSDKFSLAVMGQQYLALADAVMAGRFPTDRSAWRRGPPPFTWADRLPLPSFDPHDLPPSLFHCAYAVRRGLRRVLPTAWVGKTRYF